MKLKLVVLGWALLGGVAISYGASADQNWPQWRGPLGTGVAPHANPPTTWTETNNVKWKTKIPGYGTSTPIIWENQVFIQTAISAKNPEPKTLPAAPTEPAEPGQRRRRGGGGRSEGPTDPHQFTLLSMDRATGKTVWQKALRQAIPHEGHHSDHGFASDSPVTDGEHVFS